MLTIFLILHLLAAAILIFVVLLQSGKAGDLASTFGGATSQTAFGARGAATMLTKVTTGCAITFMVTSLALSILMSRQGAVTVMDEVSIPEPATQEEIPVDESSSPGSPSDASQGTTEPGSGENE